MSVPSVIIAKDRLKALVIADRMNCTPEMTENFTKDVYHVVSKYLEISQEHFHVKFNRNDIQIILTGEKD